MICYNKYMKNDIKISKEEEKFDDDCEICKLMAKGEHNYGDLMEAFAKQNTKNKLNEKTKQNKK